MPNERFKMQAYKLLLEAEANKLQGKLIAVHELIQKELMIVRGLSVTNQLMHSATYVPAFCDTKQVLVIGRDCLENISVAVAEYEAVVAEYAEVTRQ